MTALVTGAAVSLLATTGVLVQHDRLVDRSRKRHWRHRGRSPTWPEAHHPNGSATPSAPPEVGRELGDAGGPLLVGVAAAPSASAAGSPCWPWP
jgi:hypothetical protein